MKKQQLTLFLFLLFIGYTDLNAMNKEINYLSLEQKKFHIIFTLLAPETEHLYNTIISEQNFVNNQFYYPFLLQNLTRSSSSPIATKKSLCSYYHFILSRCSEESLPPKHSLFVPIQFDK